MENKENNNEVWLWRMYREVAQFVHNPTVATEAELISLISQYRKENADQPLCCDEHEWAANYQ